MSYATREEYRAAWEAAAEVQPVVPLNLDIEVASVCNLRCPFCFIPDPSFDAHIKTPAQDGKPRARLMPVDLAKRIIDQAAAMSVPAIKFNWRGESTLHPQYAEIVRYARRKQDWRKDRMVRGFWDILANTNANCSDSSIDGLMATTKCMVSLDSLVSETYAVMRRGGDLDRAKEVIRELLRRGHPNLWVRRVLTKDNKDEPFKAQVYAEFGALPNLHVSQHYCFDRNAASRHEAPGCDHDGQPVRTYCKYPSQRTTVASTGLVYPCCIDLHEEMPIGDLTKQTLTEVWDGEPMRRLRSELKANTFSSRACRDCQSWMSHDSPQREYVQDVEVLA